MPYDPITIVTTLFIGLSSFAVVFCVLIVRELLARSKAGMLLDDLEPAFVARLRKVEHDLTDIKVSLQILELRAKSAFQPPLVQATRGKIAEGVGVPSRRDVMLLRRPARDVNGDDESLMGETDLGALRLLREGPRSSRELEKLLARSREHTARLMKKLYDVGLVSRDVTTKPFVYSLTEKGATVIGSNGQAAS